MVRPLNQTSLPVGKIIATGDESASAARNSDVVARFQAVNGSTAAVLIAVPRTTEVATANRGKVHWGNQSARGAAQGFT